MDIAGSDSIHSYSKSSVMVKIKLMSKITCYQIIDDIF